MKNDPSCGAKDPSLGGADYAFDVAANQSLLLGNGEFAPTYELIRATIKVLTMQTAVYLIQLTGGRLVRLVELEPGAAAPSWNRYAVSDAFFDRPSIVSRVTVGRDWLAINFPAAWARSRLLAEPLDITPREMQEYNERQNTP